MPRLKRLSGAEVVDILEQFGFQVYSQRGSHVKLRRVSTAHKETLTVPIHRQLDTGTCRSIYRQACRYIPETELFSYFYQ
ncbi:type II toxin-antitoxin system HicA family toxin [Candidatus Synechococcus calcipolaris G9]|uniref:Type II toxin-antitoxin system HicA family toxin n=1 Tax=Candidatus Synechococcus calcipolaris G9 TaxID=1497997 RepID=A0ABT6F253_9SYNE|nr:type II toxin-antitoxin system HicA family toxin [Candidatus Synechococcus calcipolaris]MDG2991931.1 type II toxin-antitoxin system HicA family toxin [Candidatus Synechococcus calcipolaris G9]